MREIPDPRAQLSPTARRVLEGAWQVALRSGFGSLTLSKISKASNENVAAVKYYFGNKAGLVTALLDAVIYDMVSGLASALREVPPSEPAAKLAIETRMLNQPSEAGRIFIDVLAEALRDKKLLERVRRYNKVFYELHLEQLREAYGMDGAHTQVKGLASLLSAIGDGLALMGLIAPSFFDMDEAIAALAGLFEHGVSPLAEPVLSESTSSDSPDDQPSSRRREVS